MADTTISEMLFTMMSLLFLLLGVVLFVSIIMSAINPYEQVIFANTEKLRAAMDEVCTTGSDLSIKFDLPQNTPALSGVFTLIPTWIIRIGGDPHYVLYYESYPPGDALGWEIYHQMQNRIVAPLPDGNNKNIDYVNNYVLSLQDLWKTKVADNPGLDIPSKELEGIVINNIALSVIRSDYQLSRQQGEKLRTDVGPKDILKDIDSYGEWKENNEDEYKTPIEGDSDNSFRFKNYRSLTAFEKTAIKYEPCGDNSLCLKTRGAVYRFPLRQCNDVKYVEMVYDARNRKVVYGGIGVALVTAATVVCIAGTGGICAVPVAGGTISAANVPAVGAAVEFLPEAFIGLTATGETIPVVLGAGAGGTLEVLSTPAAVASSSGTLSSIAGFFLRGGWKIASKFVSGVAKGGLWLIKKAPFPIPSAIGAGVLGAGGVASYKVGEFLVGAMFSYKVQDFNIASPCSISQMTIKRVSCSQLECSRFDSYPIYSYGGDGKLHPTGTHYTCAEKINNDIDDQPSLGKPAGSCLQVVVHDKADGYCWTPDPYKETWWSDTQLIASAFGLYPVHDATSYISSGSNGAYVLKHYPMGVLEGWKDWFERKISWSWG